MNARLLNLLLGLALLFTAVSDCKRGPKPCLCDKPEPLQVEMDTVYLQTPVRIDTVRMNAPSKIIYRDLVRYANAPGSDQPDSSQQKTLYREFSDSMLWVAITDTLKACRLTGSAFSYAILKQPVRQITLVKPQGKPPWRFYAGAGAIVWIPQQKATPYLSLSVQPPLAGIITLQADPLTGIYAAGYQWPIRSKKPK